LYDIMIWGGAYEKMCCVMEKGLYSGQAFMWN